MPEAPSGDLSAVHAPWPGNTLQGSSPNLSLISRWSRTTPVYNKEPPMNRLPVWPDQDSTGVLLSNTDQLSLYNHNVVREAKAMVQTCFWMFTAHLEISSHLALGDLWLTRWGTIQTSNFWEWRGVPSEMVLVNFLFCVQGIKPTFTLIITKVFF